MNRSSKRTVCDLSWCHLNVWFDENEVSQIQLIDKKNEGMNIETTAEWFANEFLTSAAFILTNIPEISEFRKKIVQGQEAIEKYYDELSE